MSKIALSAVNQKPRDTWRKHFALLFNQAVGGKNDQGILAVWYAWITAESGKTIYGNNPMNMTCSTGDGCYTGQIGWYQFPGNSRKFAAFATPQDGAKAVASLLTVSRYRYPAITKAAAAGDWQAMIEAISHSCWVSCSRPGYMRGGTISLYSIWNTMRGLVATDVANGSIGNIPKPQGPDFGTPTTVSSKTLTLPFRSLIRTFKLLGVFQGETLDDGLLVQWYTNSAIVNALKDAVGGNANKEALNTILAEAVKYKGTPIADLPDTISVTLSPTAQKPNTDPLTMIAQSFGKLFEPETYVRSGALIVGLVLLFTGFRMMMDATSGNVSAVD